MILYVPYDIIFCDPSCFIMIYLFKNQVLYYGESKLDDVTVC